LQAIKAKEVSTSHLLVELECECCFSILEHKDFMPGVEAHPMHDVHLQITLKTKGLQLQIALYNYGDGAPQERIN
jgi:hypothetical protein